MSRAYLGIDFGTSGARAIVINAEQQVLCQASIKFDASDTSVDQNLAATWKTNLFSLINQIPVSLRQAISSIAINGTSSTVLVCNDEGIPLHPPLLYNDARGATVLDQVKSIAPAGHTVISATSSLTKLLWLLQKLQLETQYPTTQTPYFLHQADWLSFLLHGKLGMSDYHNALKLGYDVATLNYPDWIKNLSLPLQLPVVLAPGTPIAPILPELANQLGFSTHCMICAGTTDSIAAFLASGATHVGDAVTSLGSTLVLKLLSQTRVDRAEYGIYSHRLGDLWLVGGASNTGGAVLQQFFSNAELQQLSQQVDLSQASPFHYYPLLKPGERFPINDPELSPCLEPRPIDPVQFLQGLLEGIARIEARGYQLLQELGATPVAQVYTAGGGANNLVWTQIRSRHLKLPVLTSPQTEAAYGSALLAQRNILFNFVQHF